MSRILRQFFRRCLGGKYLISCAINLALQIGEEWRGCRRHPVMRKRTNVLHLPKDTHGTFSQAVHDLQQDMPLPGQYGVNLGRRDDRPATWTHLQRQEDGERVLELDRSTTLQCRPDDAGSVPSTEVIDCPGLRCSPVFYRAFSPAFAT